MRAAGRGRGREERARSAPSLHCRFSSPLHNYHFFSIVITWGVRGSAPVDAPSSIVELRDAHRRIPPLRSLAPRKERRRRGLRAVREAAGSGVEVAARMGTPTRLCRLPAGLAGGGWPWRGLLGGSGSLPGWRNATKGSSGRDRPAVLLPSR